VGSQTSVVQTTVSSHVGAGTTVWHVPSTQASSPSQNRPSSQTIGVPAHPPSLQTSSSVHGFSSSHRAVLLAWVQAPSPSQWSSVQTFPSSVHGVSAGLAQFRAASLHVSLHSWPAAHGSPLCTAQAPPLHLSVPLQ
jgi:hypothetical protein